MHEFNIGQKVVCVDPHPNDGKKWIGSEAPVIGAIYTITDMYWDEKVDSLCLVFCEIERSQLAKWEHDNDNLGYAAWRFRPIVEKKTDISIFKRFLIEQPDMETA